VSTSEDDNIGGVGLIGRKSGGDILIGESTGVDFGGPIGAVWFVESEFFGVFTFEILVMGRTESGGGGEDEYFAVSGQLCGGFDGWFGTDEDLVGIFGAKI